jgi:hypothetical protein
MLTTIKGLVPGATYKAHLYARARTWADMRQAFPGTPLASAAADVNGTLVLDLPTRTEIGVQDSTGRLFQINNATTVVTSP